MQPNNPERNAFMLTGPLARKGYDWWWHNFTARHAKTGEERAFFIEYFLCNPAQGGDAPTFGIQGDTPSYGMIKVGAWGEGAKQIHSYYAWSEIDADTTRLAVRMGQNRLSETHMSGSAAVTAADADAHPEWASDAGSLRWDLSINKQIAYSVGAGASAPARALNVFEMYWHAEGIKTAYSGWVELDGERYDVTPETCFGYADKNWGGDFTSPWLWISSCDLVSRTRGRLENSAIEIGGGRPKVLGIALDRRLLAYFAYEGEEIEFNFSKPWLRSTVSFDFNEGLDEHNWHVEAIRPKERMVLDLTCAVGDMIHARYQSPDGARRHNRLWNGGTGRGVLRLYRKKGANWAEDDVIDVGHAGCEYGEYDDNPTP